MGDKNLRYIHNMVVLSGNMLMTIMAIHWQKPSLINTAHRLTAVSRENRKTNEKDPPL
jgi:hypothetical protein